MTSGPLRTRRGLATLVVSVIAAVGVVFPCSPAWACSCVERTDAQHFESASAVFVGVPMGEPRGDDPYVWTFEVRSVQKGEVAAVEEVQVLDTEVEDCGFRFEPGRRYQVFAVDYQGSFLTDHCSGTIALRAGDEPVTAETVGGKGGSRFPKKRLPSPLPQSPSPDDPADPAPAGSEEADGGVSPGLVALVLLGIVGAVAALRRRR